MAGVGGWFASRGEIPLVPPHGLREYGPLADDPERPDEAPLDESIRGVAFALEYCDARSWASTRTIRCLGLDRGAPASLRAFCNVRGTTRSFRLDRIISIIHLRSGRILDGSEQVALLAPYLGDEHPEAADLRALQTATGSGVFALLQVAMPDGRLTEHAREIVLDYIRAEAAAVPCPVPPWSVVELWVDNLSPPVDCVVAAVDRMLAERDKFVRLLPWLLKLMRTRDDFAVQEQSVRELIAEVRLHYRRKLFEWPSRATR